VHNSLLQAEAKNIGVNSSEVAVITPCFMSEIDVKAGALTGDHMQWGLTTWASGHYAVAPADAKGKVSSYDIMDELVEYYMDRSKFPNLHVRSTLPIHASLSLMSTQTVVVAGHSLGGQMVQRYAAMRKDQLNEGRLHYWVGK
jgi:hypothetical protein